MRLSAPGSSSDEESLAGQDQEAPWFDFDLLARALRALVDCLVLSADCWGEPADRSIEELLELDEEELSDGSWATELLGSWESEWSKDILIDEKQGFVWKGLKAWSYKEGGFERWLEIEKKQN